MKRYTALVVTAALGFVAGMALQSAVPARAHSVGVTGAASFETSVYQRDSDKRHFRTTHGWVVIDEQLYRCTRRHPNDTPGDEVSFDCVQQTLRIE